MNVHIAAVPVCPKCGIIKKSGDASCCAVDGSWFLRCGMPGDPRFSYTWAEGIEACKRKLRASCIVPFATLA